MTYLIEQLFVVLVIAFVVGLCVGWITSGKNKMQKAG